MKACEHCNKEFIVTVDRNKFCSRPCQSMWAISIASLSRSGPPKTGQTLNCLTCNKGFYVAKYRIKSGKVKYCSRSCLAKHLLPQYNDIHGFKKLNKPKHTYKTIKIDGKWIREHRYIMQQHLGRKLESWEHVHHINDDSSDNRLENLVVLSNSDHQRHELEFRKKITSSSFSS